MALEGLRAILDKEAVLATASVRELLDAPQVVEERYKHHVRAYLPLGRAAGSREDQLSVQEYEKRLISRAKEGAAPTGYITAEFGYGKTSTATFLWQQCREANLLAVPPFKIEQLSDLLIAAYAWGRHELRRTRPALLEELEGLYQGFSERGIEADAGGSEAFAQRLSELQRQGRYSANLTIGDLLAFIEQYTALLLKAGYDGVVILPDEVQQYTDPAINSGDRDPLSNLFLLVNGLATRPRGALRATVIFVMPARELGVVSSLRRDIVDRLQANGLGFDLTNIYDDDFATRLWARLAQVFEFSDVADEIVEPDALRGLGQIARRGDLGSGPRTVVDGFRLMTERYLAAIEHGDNPATYQAINLTEDFLNGNLRFVSAKYTREVTAALNNRLVAGRLPRELAVKLLAAFPSYGAPASLISTLDLTAAVADLEEQQLTLRPGGRDAAGNAVEGITLRQLAPNRGGGDWLTSAISEFIRLSYTYQEGSSRVIERAANAFKTLLQQRVFKGKWRAEDDVDATSMRDAALLLVGSFPQTAAKYPERRIYVKIVRDGNRAEASEPLADLTIECDLRRYLDLPEADRRGEAGSFIDADPSRLRLTLNAWHQSSKEMYPTLQQNLGDLVAPHRVTPLMLLNLYHYLDEQLTANHVPKSERDQIENTFMPDLLDVITIEMFNPQVTKGKVGGVRIVEEGVAEALKRRYPSYVTLLAQGRERAMLDYITALGRLKNPFQRSGSEPVSGTKDEIAALFNRTNTTFDTFIGNYPSLLRVVRDWKSKQAGEVLFTLHPREQAILDQLSTSPDRDPQSQQPRILRRGLLKQAATEGYRDEEIESLLQIMRARGLADGRGDYLVRLESRVIGINELRQRFDAHLARLTRLLAAFATDSVLLDQHDKVSKLINDLASRQQVDEHMLARAEMTINTHVNLLNNWRRSKHDEMYKNVRLVRPAERPAESDRAIIERPYAGLLATQVEPLRERAAAEVAGNGNGLVELMAEYRRLQQMVPRLEQDSTAIDDETLIAAQQIYDGLRRAKDKSDADASVARQRVAEWHEVSALLAQADDIHRDIESEGPEGQVARLAWGEWERRVRSDLAVNKLTAFAATQDWRSGLNRVRQRLAEVRETAASNFNETQARYRRVLHQLAMSDEGLPAPVAYNPQNAGNSRSRLHTDMLESWRKIIQREAQRTQQLIGDVQRVRAGLGQVVERRRAELQVRCAALSAQLEDIRMAIINLRSVEPEVSAGPEEFAKVGAALQAIRGDLSSLEAQVAELRGSLDRSAPSETEQRIYNQVRELPSDEGYIDAAAVLTALDSADGGKRDQFWRDIGGLQDKQLIRVKIQPIDNE